MRIPKPTADQLNHHKMDNHASQKPSRLVQLQSDYQQRLLKEKEDRMIQMYKENQKKALERVNQHTGKGMVRDFFEERRINGSANKSDTHVPSIEHQFLQKKLQYKQVNGGLLDSALQNEPQQKQMPKNSAGRDRSNLLAPIDRSSIPVPHKPQIVRPRTLKKKTSNDGHAENKDQVYPKSAPSGKMVQDDENSSSASDDSPPPNLSQLKSLQRRKLLIQGENSNRTDKTTSSTKTKNSDFQNWQIEQDKTREERLRKNREKNNQVPRIDLNDVEEYEEDSNHGTDSSEELKRKQQELMERIAQQQAELERLRHERLKEEEQERKEMERKKRLEEERRKRKTEEEEEIKAEEEERMKQQYEEERQRKVQEEKQRIKKVSDKYENKNSNNDQDLNQSKGAKSSPSQKSLEGRKPVPPSHQKPFRAQPTVPKSTEHTKFYEQVPIDEDEQSHGNMKLVSCNNCGRSFAEDRIDKHEAACKNRTKKRKPLDPAKMRTQGTEMAKYQHAANKPSRELPKKSNWRSQHESFVNAIRYAKTVSKVEKEGGNLANLPPPPPSDTSGYEQCPHCSRKFKQAAAERHIPWCKEQKSRQVPQPKKR
ncbi:hypothetical protein CHS0354_029096 [Potamilus streckersoni]|uniref:C2HC/C3H-type domain-containing protein n=1 Tax=Potamilus streckersoni TaxID=2493646 RepID=A0AAE0SX40_9BIVA|nr:hypothetical protein CHS0354_029096 [Potamilus streckersoni]